MNRRKMGKGIRRALAVRHGVLPNGERFTVSCEYCGVDGWIRWMGPVPYDSITSSLEIDHIVPVSKGGSHNPSNMTLACYSCNASKCDRTFDEWFQILKSKRSRHPRRQQVLDRMGAR